MKKFLSIFAVMCLLIIPSLCFVGCKNDDNAQTVINRTYYVTKVVKDGQNTSAYATKNKMRIVFMENNFKVEIGDSTNSTTYGYYYGTFEIDENNISLNISHYGGIWATAASDINLKDYIIKNLEYRSGKLHTEFINNHCILQYTFELPSSN